MSEKGFFAFIEKVVTYVTNTLMALNIILIIVSVFFRYVLSKPIVWSEELAKFLLVWIVFLAASNSIRHWDNLRVTLVLDRLSPKALAIADTIIKFISFAFISFLFISCVEINSQCLAPRDSASTWDYNGWAPAWGHCRIRPYGPSVHRIVRKHCS